MVIRFFRVTEVRLSGLLRLLGLSGLLRFSNKAIRLSRDSGLTSRVIRVIRLSRVSGLTSRDIRVIRVSKLRFKRVIEVISLTSTLVPFITLTTLITLTGPR